MLQQDYIMRLIQEFFKALQRLLLKRDPETRREAIKEMYKTYVGDYDFYQSANIDEIMRAMESYAEEQRIYRIEMLAELYYVEADMRPQPMSDQLLEKAMSLFYFVDRHSGTYSIVRLRKIGDIQQRLGRSSS